MKNLFKIALLGSLGAIANNSFGEENAKPRTPSSFLGEQARYSPSSAEREGTTLIPRQRVSKGFLQCFQHGRRVINEDVNTDAAIQLTGSWATIKNDRVAMKYIYASGENLCIVQVPHPLIPYSPSQPRLPEN